MIVGQGKISGGSRAFRWTQSGGMVALAPLPGDTDAAATAVSANGAIVFGMSSPRLMSREITWALNGADTRAFCWTQATGVQDLKQLLVADGRDLTGLNIVSITGISADG